MRSSIDEALLRTVTVNPVVQNETVNACSYLDLTVKPDTSKMNASTTSTSAQLADVVANSGNASHHSHTQVSLVAAMTTTATTTNTSSLPSSSSLQYNQAPVCHVTHLASNQDMQDLAEADQSIENDVTNNENAANSPELLNTSAENGDLIPNNEISNEGAVGGILNEGGGGGGASSLPDLAKITTINSSTPNTVPLNCEIDYVDTDL